ncbi:hypothetical protein [Paraburkholderia sp.]|uniref:hypothetical protein n=1 Tax=Paraburkholderia sp. TaxID=1926495 RepID=UPI0039E61B6A
MTVDYVNRPEDAYVALRRGQYGIVITSIALPESNSRGAAALDECGGLTFLGKLCAVPYASSRAPAIIYSYHFSQADGVPPNVYGVARNRAQLVQFVFDIVERGFPQAECARRSDDVDPTYTFATCHPYHDQAAAAGHSASATRPASSVPSSGDPHTVQPVRGIYRCSSLDRRRR